MSSHRDAVLLGGYVAVGGRLVLSFKFDQNRLSGYRDFMGQNLGSCITLASGSYSPVLPYRRDVNGSIEIH